MKKILIILPALLFGLPFSQAMLGEEFTMQAHEQATEFVRQVAKPQNPAPGSRDTRLPLEALVQVMQELVSQRARTDDKQLARELDNTITTIQRIMGIQRVIGEARPTVQPLIPIQNAAKTSLDAEREKAYIELARQYFYVFATTPVANKTDEEANEEGNVASEPVKDQRAEILDNFTACMRKISPAAQIALIQELIRSSHTNEELKLLEGLLDEVCVQPTVQR